jgi:hypothetical protein
MNCVQLLVSRKRTIQQREKPVKHMAFRVVALKTIFSKFYQPSRLR